MHDKQHHLLTSISKTIFKQSYRFDLDTKGTQSKFDEFIYSGVVQKTLEADSIIFVEGMRPHQQPKFMTPHQFKLDYAKEENWETFSAGDTQAEYDEKFEIISDREINHPGWFEKKAYFERIFPSLKVQKPGYDLYGSTTCVLGLMVVYIFMYYESYSYS